MRRLILLLLALVASVAGAQVASDVSGQHGPIGQPPAVVMHLPLSESGALFEEDANTVAHVIWAAIFNYLAPSETLCALGTPVAPWVDAGPTTCTADALGTLDLFSATGLAGGIRQNPVGPNPGTLTYGLSFDAAPAGSTSVTATLKGQSSAVSSCSCNGNCTWTISLNACKYKWTGLTGITRLTATAVSAVPSTEFAVALFPGDYDAAVAKSAYFGRVQIELTEPTGNYVATTGVQVTTQALMDLSGNAWTQNGTVPQVAANVGPFVPGKAGAGPFTGGTNYYRDPNTTGPLDFTGDFTACFTYATTSLSQVQVIVGDALNGVSGWAAYVNVTDGTLRVSQYSGGGSIPVGSAAVLNGPNVGCVGRSGSTLYVKNNLGTTASTVQGVITPATSTNATIGVWSSNLALPLVGTIYEVHATTTPWSEATVTRQMRRAFGMLGSKGEPIALTRATTATYEANGRIWTAPAGALRIESNGGLAESARTNVLLASGTVTTGTALNASWLAVGAPTYSTQGTALDGTGTWGRITTGAAGDAIYQTRGVASTTTLTASTWARADTGTDTPSVQASCQSGTNAGCTCGRSDGGATVARPGVTATWHCTCDATAITTVPVRFWATATCGAAITAAAFAITPGSYNVATGTADFWGAQLEAGPYPTSYNPTAGTAVARSVDVPTATAPSLPLSDWTIKGNFLPYMLRAWSQAGRQALLSLGAPTASNTELLWQDNGTVYASIYDQPATVAYTSISSASFTAGTVYNVTHRNARGAQSLLANALIDTVQSGAGTNIWSVAPTALYIGNTSDTTRAWDGYIKDLRLCRSSVLARCK